MRKGFTLIEILGVIILLGIIALITFSVITGLIKNTKEKAFEDSILNTEEAAYNYYASKVLYDDANNETCYIFDYGNDVSEEVFIETKDGKNYYKIPTSSMSVKNDNFTEGTIVVCSDSITSILSNGDLTYNDNNITDGSLSKNDKTKPIINGVTFSNTSKSITVNVNAIEEDFGKIAKYYYSIDGENFIDSNNNSYTFTDLVLDNEYEVFIKVSNEGDLISTYSSKTTTLNISAPTYSINPLGYATSKVINVLYPSGYTKEYSLDGGNTWNEYINAIIFTSNGTIIARASDGTNYVTGSSYTVTNIDTSAPTVSNTVSGAVATITLGDNLSLSGYAITNSATTPTTWTTISGTSISRNYTATVAGTYYAWVKDSAGNINSISFAIAASAFAPTCITTKSNLGTTSGVTVVVSGTGITSGAGTFTGVTSSRTYTVYNSANVSATCSVTITPSECNCSSTPRYCCDYQAYDANGNWICTGSYYYCGDNRSCSTCYN